MKRFLPLLLSMVVGSISAQTIKPGFYAKEGMKTYYRMGWDSIEEAGTIKQRGNCMKKPHGMVYNHLVTSMPTANTRLASDIQKSNKRRRQSHPR